MNKRSFVSHPIKLTELSFKVVQARLSLRETQSQFAKRFMVDERTIYRWERGSIDRVSRIYMHILDTLLAKLEKEGRLMPAEAVKMIFIDTQEIAGNALG